MKSYAFAVLASAAAAISADTLEFVNYAARYNKAYDVVNEFKSRSELFEQNHKLISEHNSTKGQNFLFGHNQFSDWTDEEYQAILTYKVPENYENHNRNVEVSNESNSLETVNWVEHGAVTPVMDQGHCGASWAFSTTGVLESAHFVATGELLSFSE